MRHAFEILLTRVIVNKLQRLYECDHNCTACYMQMISLIFYSYTVTISTAECPILESPAKRVGFGTLSSALCSKSLSSLRRKSNAYEIKDCCDGESDVEHGTILILCLL